jgi:hypothetical protein
MGDGTVKAQLIYVNNAQECKFANHLGSQAGVVIVQLCHYDCEFNLVKIIFQNSEY